MDMIVGLPSTKGGQNAIFTFVDRLTKMAHLVPTTFTLDARGAALLYMNNVLVKHGLSKSIVSETLVKVPLEKLPFFFLKYGQHPLTPASLLDSTSATSRTTGSPQQWLVQHSETLQIAKDAIVAAQARQAFYFDKSRQLPRFKAGEDVMVHRHFLIIPEARDRPCDKLRPRWYGPFKISEQVGTNAFRLELPGTLGAHPVFNVTALKKYHLNTLEGRVPPPPPITDLDGFTRYIVEKILNHRTVRRQVQFLAIVKWEGYKDPTWEPQKFLKDESGKDILPLRRYKERHSLSIFYKFLLSYFLSYLLSHSLWLIRSTCNLQLFPLVKMHNSSTLLLFRFFCYTF